MTWNQIILVYLLFRLKQLICDFFFQTSWMALKKGKALPEGALPLISHSAIHATGTLIIAMIVAPAFWWLGPVDFLIHATIDRSKAVLNEKKGWTPESTEFWWAIGIDQEAHNLTHLAYLILMVSHAGFPG